MVDQDGNTLETFDVDPLTGTLTQIDILESNNNPSFVGFFWAVYFIYTFYIDTMYVSDHMFQESHTKKQNRTFILVDLLSFL